jgi:hypothetical protein
MDEAMSKGYERAVALTKRVKVGAYYTDGKCLAQVHKVASLGHIMLEVVEGGESTIYGYGIYAFRRHWWLVRESESVPSQSVSSRIPLHHWRYRAT